MPLLDLSPERLVNTTHTVHGRLDFFRSVEPEVLQACPGIALQAPSGSNRQGWHFLIVRHASKRLDGLPGHKQAALWASLLPATWNFMFAAHRCGLDAAWTTFHLDNKQATAEILDISYQRITQGGSVTR